MTRERYGQIKARHDVAYAQDQKLSSQRKWWAWRENPYHVEVLRQELGSEFDEYLDWTPESRLPEDDHERLEDDRRTQKEQIMDRVAVDTSQSERAHQERINNTLKQAITRARTRGRERER
jgi:hypothetical protein